MLTGYAEKVHYESLWIAPDHMRQQLIAAIRQEIESHKSHGNGHLIFKMNSLVDRETIRALYAASMAGVKVDLIVRGICCLRPGVPGVSESIRVMSIVSRFLEHSRIYFFQNGDAPRLYIGSADAMERNFDRRVEVVTPVESPEIAGYLRNTLLDAYLRDTVNARILQPDGSYRKVKVKSDDDVFDVQAWLTTQYRHGPVTANPACAQVRRLHTNDFQRCGSHSRIDPEQSFRPPCRRSSEHPGRSAASLETRHQR
jgi:polyphosphate kinase